MDKVLVLGASGATGRLLVKILLQKGLKVIAIVRTPDLLVSVAGSDANLKIVEAEISRMTEYELALHLFPSPTRNAIFNSAPSSRINVAEFMSELAMNSALWNLWRGRMPVVYNRAILDNL